MQWTKSIGSICRRMKLDPGWKKKKHLKNGLKTYWRSQVIKLLENIKKEARNIDLDNDVLDLRLKEWVP